MCTIFFLIKQTKMGTNATKRPQKYQMATKCVYIYTKMARIPNDNDNFPFQGLSKWTLLASLECMYTIWKHWCRVVS
jgi:hypothetical protein